MIESNLKQNPLHNKLNSEVVLATLSFKHSLIVTLLLV